MTTTNDPFDRLHDALVASAARSTPRSVRIRRGSRRIAVLAGVGVLAAGTAVAATAPWRPQLGGEHGQPQATPATTPVPEELTALVGALRRPQVADDRAPAVQRALRRLGANFGGGIYVDGIRRLRVRSDGAVLLVPMQRVGSPNAPRDLQIRDGLCVFSTFEGPALAGASCGSVADLRRGQIRSLTTGLVPDGVHGVRVTLSTGEVLNAKVTDNYYELPYTIPTVPLSADRTPSAATRAANREQERAIHRIVERPVSWLDADGNVIDRIGP